LKYKYIWSPNTFEVHIHLKYKYIWSTNTLKWSPTTGAFMWSKLFSFPCDFTDAYVPIHLRYTYIWSTNTFEVQIHLRYTYIWSTNIFEVLIHLKYKYIWSANTLAAHIHLKYKYIWGTNTLKWSPTTGLTPIFYDPRCVSIACCYCNRSYIRCWVVLLLGLPMKYWKSAGWIPGSSEFTKGEEVRQEKLKQCSHSTQTGVSKHTCRSQDCRCCVCVCVCSHVLVSMWIACAWECQAYV